MTKTAAAKSGGRGRISMRLILSVTTVALISASLISLGWLAERNARTALTDEIEARLLVEARNLASLSVDALLTEYPELTLCPLVKEIQTDRPDLAFVTVLDHEQKIQGHVDLAVLGTASDVVSALQDQPSGQRLLAGERILGDDELLVASVPARHANGKTVGSALVGLKLSYVDEIVARPRRSFLILTAALLAAGIAVTLVLMSWLLRPIAALRSGLERIGRGDLDTEIRVAGRTELGRLAENINGMARQLKASQAKMLEKDRLDHEMDLARQIQQSLLPEGALAAGEFRLLGSNRAAAEVGGDFYDYFELPGGRIGLVVADVSGKGLGGCLVTSMLAVLLRALRDFHDSPRELLIALENEMDASLAPGTFITIFYGILDPDTGGMTFASAAHSPLLVRRAADGRIDEYRTTGIPLGAMRRGILGRTLEDEAVTLEPGDVLLQYTDGLNESWNPQKQEQFGFERVRGLIDEAAGGDLETLLETLGSAAERWSRPGRLGDDLTLVALAREGAPVAGTAPGSASGGGHASARVLLDGDLETKLDGLPRLTLPSDIDRLVDIRPWLEADPQLGGLSGELKMLVETSLYEICANVIEHGYGGESGHATDIWWIPGASEAAVRLFPDLARDRDEAGSGFFVVRDTGEPIRPDEWTPPDLDDPACRRRGRGLGLQIVHSSMKEFDQLPGTPAGNLTLLQFDPHLHATHKESQNV